MFHSIMQRSLLALLTVVFTANSTYALLDDFEDGDYTNNPQWTLTNILYGTASVQPDPVQPDNLALQIHGTEEAHYMLDTPVQLPFAGFDGSIEFLATASDYHPLIYVKNDDVQFGIGYTLDPAKPQYPDPRLYLMEQAPGVDDMYMTTTSKIPLNTWVRLRMWHDPASNVVYGQVSLVSDGSLIGEISFAPLTDLSIQEPASTLRIGAEETSWQYIDNVNLGSMPTPVLVSIDIKPCSYPNSINLGSNGVVPVAILSSSTFDATTADPETITLAGAGVAVRGKGSKYLAGEEDVDGDGLFDIIVHVETENLNPGTFMDGYAMLTGTTLDGVNFEGYDEIRIVPME